MSRFNHIQNYFLDAKEVIEKILQDDRPDLRSIQSQIGRAAEVMIETLKRGNKIITCGNGGSMCDAMHFASELTGRYKESRKPIPAIAISDTAGISCTANDFGYKEVFARPILALGNTHDVLLAISTSGRSENIVEAVKAAYQKGMIIVMLTGGTNVEIDILGMIGVMIAVPSTKTNMIQQLHVCIIHILVELIEKELCAK